MLYLFFFFTCLITFNSFCNLTPPHAAAASFQQSTAEKLICLVLTETTL